jgi:hypothetical protein
LVVKEYISHGHSINYEGFYPQANATLYVFNNSSIDPNYIWLAWAVDKGFNDISYGTNNAPDLGGMNSAAWMESALSTLEDGIEVSF